MKHCTLSILVLVILLLLPISVSRPQVSVDLDKGDQALLVSLNYPVDSVTTVTSKWFGVKSYLVNSFNDYPIQYARKLNSVKGLPKVTTTIEGSNDQTNVAIVDTLGGVSDSIETYTSGTLNLNNKKFWYYRIKQTGQSGNRADVTARVDLLFIKP